MDACRKGGVGGQNVAKMCERLLWMPPMCVEFVTHLENFSLLCGLAIKIIYSHLK